MSKLVDEIKENLKKKHTYQDVKITPAMAAELLELNINNRPLKARTVAFYAEEIKKGRWLQNGDSIRFSRDGRLIDGQHRLSAIILADAPIVTDIKTGLDDEAFAVIDAGKNRTVADVVAIAGYKDSGVLSYAIKMIMAYDCGTMAKGTKTVEKTQRKTPKDVLDWLEQKGDKVIIDCITSAKQYHKDFNKIMTPNYAGFLYLFSRKNIHQAKDFFSMLSTGENISKSKNSAIYLLRQKLINYSGVANSNMDVVNKYALIIKAWNFWREGREVGRLYWSTDEEFPKIK